MNTTLGRQHGPHTNAINPAQTSPDAWWAISLASLAAALIAGEIAVNLVVAGASSKSQITTLRWSGFTAAMLGVVAIGALGVAQRADRASGRPPTVRRPGLLRWIVGLALAIEAGRVIRFAIRLLHEIRLQRGEPLTVLEVGLNLLIAVLVFAAIGVTWWLVPSNARTTRR